MTERSSRFGLVLLAVILAPPLVAGVYDSTIPRDEVGIRVSSDKRLTASENIADWFEQMAGPGDQIYGLCSGAALAGSVDSDPPLRYLWFLDIESVKGAREEMIAMLSGPGAPRYVALINPVEKCDDTGATAAVLERRYAEVAVFEDFPVLELQPGT